MLNTIFIRPSHDLLRVYKVISLVKILSELQYRICISRDHYNMQTRRT